MHPLSLPQILKLLLCAVIVKAIVSVLLEYVHYLPPDFQTGFLRGRQGYFWQGYHLAFYVHIASGPGALLLGLVLMSERLRQRHAAWHRKLGKWQVACVLLAVAPSGLIMALHAQTGVLAGIAFATLAIATGLSAWRGYRYATQRHFREHRRWMVRCYLLLCSAVTLRLMGGAFTILGLDSEWTYIAAAWLSWLMPLAAFEIVRSLAVRRIWQERTAALQ